MGGESVRSPGSFRQLGECLLSEAFPEMNANEIDRYLDRAVARVHEATGAYPQQLLRASQAEVLELIELGRNDFLSAHASRAVAMLTATDLINHLATQPSKKLLARKLVTGFVETLDIMRALDEASGATSAIKLPASCTLDLARHLGSDPTTRDRIRTRAADLAVDLHEARNLVRTVDLSIDMAIDLASTHSDRDLVRSLADARTSARSLDQGLGLDHVLALYLRNDIEQNRVISFDDSRYQELDRGRDRSRLLRLTDSVASASDSARAHNNALAQDLARIFLPIGQLNLDRLDYVSATALREAVNDLSGANLQEVNLAGMDLEGIRWSPTTQWPEEWRAQIDHDSVVIGHDLYEIRPGANTADSNLVLTPL